MALNKLKKWIGTQAMTAFFDQLNDNVDATNAAIDVAEQLRSRLSVEGDLFATVDTLTPNRTQAIHTNETTTNIPDGFKYATGLVLWRNGSPYVFLISHNGIFATCAKPAAGWSSWNVN